jgi:hypothetical protein
MLWTKWRGFGVISPEGIRTNKPGWLLVEPSPSEKWWSSSVGTIIPKYMGGKMFQTTNQFSLWSCQLSFLVTQNPHGFAKFAWNNLMVFHIKIPLNRYYTPKSPHQIFHCNYLYPIKYHYIPLIINTIYHWNTEKRNRYLIPMIRVYIYIYTVPIPIQKSLVMFYWYPVSSYLYLEIELDPMI